MTNRAETENTLSRADNELRQYYAARADEYETIYRKPERQEDLRKLASIIPSLFADRRVLEVAAGTGYWTRLLAHVARSVVATDINPEPLRIAQAKSLPPERVTFVVADAFDLTKVAGAFDGSFSGFWWSHLTASDLERFLDGLHQRLEAEAQVAFLDNRYVEGSSTPIADRDRNGNTYQDRRLGDGSIHRVLKNFPTPDDIARILGPRARALQVHEFPYYWLAVYQTAT